MNGSFLNDLADNSYDSDDQMIEKLENKTNQYYLKTQSIFKKYED